VDGFEAQTLGDGETRFRFVCDRRGTANAIDTWVAAIEALQGTSITIEDDRGTTHTNMYLESVSQPAITPYIVPGTTTVEKARFILTGLRVT